MSWEDIMRRVLPPIDSVAPHVTSRYGEVKGRPEGSTKPHRGVDFNYNVPGQRRINLAHPALRSPVTGIVTQAGRGKYGTIAIRDANGFSHEILHSHSRHVAVGDPVVAGQLIGAMGNTGASKDPKKSNHVHYQLKDPAGVAIDPSAFSDQQGPVDPNPAPPAFLGKYQQYLRGLGADAGNGTPVKANGSGPFGTGGQFVPGSASSTWPLYQTRSFAPSDEPTPPDGRKNIRRLSRRMDRSEVVLPDTKMPALPPNETPPDRPASFDDRFGNWISSPAVSAPRGPYQPGPPGVRPLGIVSGKPMPDWPFPPPIGGFPDRGPTRDEEDWAEWRLRPAEWNR
jgi:hypothetical protein